MHRKYNNFYAKFDFHFAMVINLARPE